MKPSFERCIAIACDAVRNRESTLPKLEGEEHASCFTREDLANYLVAQGIEKQMANLALGAMETRGLIRFAAKGHFRATESLLFAGTPSLFREDATGFLKLLRDLYAFDKESATTIGTMAEIKKMAVEHVRVNLLSLHSRGHIETGNGTSLPGKSNHIPKDPAYEEWQRLIVAPVRICLTPRAVDAIAEAGTAPTNQINILGPNHGPVGIDVQVGVNAPNNSGNQNNITDPAGPVSISQAASKVAEGHAISPSAKKPWWSWSDWWTRLAVAVVVFILGLIVAWFMNKPQP